MNCSDCKDNYKITKLISPPFTLIVSNLSLNTDIKTLEKHFSSYGKISKLSLA